MTLYDLLGALPNDDAEGLRTAFRRAVKGAHPDIRPGDPDAAFKFRRIVRAHEILGDAEQRAAYDHLLDLAQLEEASASGHAAAARIHKLASGVIAFAAASAVTVGGYLLFVHMSAATVTTADMMPPAMQASASVNPASPRATAGKSASAVSGENAGIAAEASGPNAAIPKTVAENMPAADAGTTSDPGTGDARPARARSAAANRNRHPNAAPGLGQASLLDQKTSPASGGRGAILYRLRKFDRAFADLAPAQPIEKPARAKSASATAGAPRPGRAPIARPVVPVPRPRMVAQDPSRQESVALMRLR